jgi:hypothetical protein
MQRAVAPAEEGKRKRQSVHSSRKESWFGNSIPFHDSLHSVVVQTVQRDPISSTETIRPPENRCQFQANKGFLRMKLELLLSQLSTRLVSPGLEGARSNRTG